MNIIKELQEDSAITRREITHWVNSQQCDLVHNTEDLIFHFKRLRSFKWNSASWATGLIIMFMVVCHHFMKFSAFSMSTEEVLGFITLWMILLGMFFGMRLNNKVWWMCRKFQKDFSIFIKLDPQNKANEVHLEELARELQVAQRRNDPNAERMRKNLKRTHEVLLAFGRCRHEDWTEYFPKMDVVVRLKMVHE